MANLLTIDLDSPDPTLAVHAFLWAMSRQRALRLMPRTEHTLIEHLMREDARVLYYSTACGLVSIVEGKDSPMDDEGLDEMVEVIHLLAKRRKRKRQADKARDLRRETVAADIDAPTTPGLREGEG